MEESGPKRVSSRVQGPRLSPGTQTEARITKHFISLLVIEAGDTGGSNRGLVADMSSHRGAEPEVKLCLLQSFRPTLQAAP